MASHGTLYIPAVQVSVSFLYNGTSTPIILDTSTPSNTRPLPTVIVDSTGAIQGSLANPIFTSSVTPGLPTSLGQKTMANSTSVAIASDQSAIPVSQSGTWNITNISGTVSLPTGASTATLQTSGNASLTSIDGKLSGTIAVSAATLPLPAGASTSALQTTGNTSLSSIDTKTPVLGQALAAGSVPVVLTAAQITTLTPLSTIAATQSGTWNINNISGTVSLPSGAATETTLAALSNKIGSIGQHAMAGSVSVAIASDQSVVPVTPSVVAAITQTFGSIVAASLTSSFATIMTLTSAAKIVAIFSSLDQPVTVSLDGGTTSFMNLESESIVLDLGTSGMKINSGAQIQVKYSGSAPTTGTVRVSVLG